MLLASRRQKNISVLRIRVLAFCLLLIISLLGSGLLALKASASHTKNTDTWQVHWINKTSIEVRDTGHSNQAYTFKGTVLESGKARFVGVINTPPCRGETKRGFSFDISKSDYESANSTKPTPIESAGPSQPGDCYDDYRKNITRFLEDTQVGFNEKSDAKSFQPASATASTEEEKPSCENGGGELSWILCPALRMASNIISGLDEQINDLLQVPNEYFEGPGGDSLKTTWGRLRNIAYIVLIPIALTMVIGTALGFEFISAYTVKRAMPRLIAAIIFMSLSFDIATFLIRLTNDVGSGILGLMTSSFADGPITLASLFDPGFAAGGLFTAALAGGAVLAAGAIPIILSYAFVVGITLLIVFLALALRQMLLVSLVLLAPLAILAWIFPSNDKLWKLWWGTFSKLLLLYPLVMVLIGGGRVFAKIVQDAPGSGFLETILILAAYIGPYFFIPTMFKLAGGFFATLSGIANDRSKGLFDRQKKFRGQKYGEGLGRAKSRNYFKGGNEHNIRGRLNRGLQGASLINNAGLNPRNMRSKMQAVMAEGGLAHMQESMEKDAAFQPIKGNDDLLAAAVHGRGGGLDARAYLESRGQTGRELEQNLAHIGRAKRSMGDHNFALAAAIANAGTGTGYAGGPGEMLQALNRAAGGDMTVAGNAMAMAGSRAEQARRFDLSGAGFGDRYGQLQAINRAQSPTETAAAVSHANDLLTDRAIDAQGPGAMLGGRGQSARNLIPAMRRRIDAANQALIDARSNPAIADNQGRTGQAKILGAERQWKQTMASTAGLLDVAGQVSPENARALADGVMAYASVDPSGVTQTVGQHVDAFREDVEFGQMRREQSLLQRQQYTAAQQNLAQQNLIPINPTI